LDALRDSPAAAAQFLVAGNIPPEGYRLRQPELAATLRSLAKGGRAGFYDGEVARLLVDGVRSAGGIWALRDLQEYRVVEREPLQGTYRGLRITTAAPPSSGGVVLLTILNILEALDWESRPEEQRLHLLVEAMRRAYRDRAEYLGDPDFVDMPLARLVHPFYAAGLARDIQPGRATPSLPFAEPGEEGRDTTHFSILDGDGNRVAATLSINYPFGSGFVAPGTGVLLNDEMDDFSARPGVPNVYGLVGGEANAIAPGKRMLSSMTPTFVESDHDLAILGTPGGSRIISMLALGVLEIEAGNSPAQWVSRPRIHHQYLPDRVQFEPDALDESQLAALRTRGHELEELTSAYGNMQAIHWDRRSGEVRAASDPRGIGRASVRRIGVDLKAPVAPGNRSDLNEKLNDVFGEIAEDPESQGQKDDGGAENAGVGVLAKPVHDEQHVKNQAADTQGQGDLLELLNIHR
jgi:gamma-glutamyltranspeptidase/glutathione hydrolase